MINLHKYVSLYLRKHSETIVIIVYNGIYYTFINTF